MNGELCQADPLLKNVYFEELFKRSGEAPSECRDRSIGTPSSTNSYGHFNPETFFHRPRRRHHNFRVEVSVSSLPGGRIRLGFPLRGLRSAVRSENGDSFRRPERCAYFLATAEFNPKAPSPGGCKAPGEVTKVK